MRPRYSLKVGEGSAVVNSFSKPRLECVFEVHVPSGGPLHLKPLTPHDAEISGGF